MGNVPAKNLRLNLECLEVRDVPSVFSSMLGHLKSALGVSSKSSSPSTSNVNVSPASAQIASIPPTLSAGDVALILDRATAASASQDGIFVVVDRNGQILGVRVEDGVDPAITSDPQLLTFAVDGAVSLARTGAYFANDQAPLTSRTIQFISQTTITQAEVESNPNADPMTPGRGPGFVAPVGIAGHFPPGIPYTPQVDLFAIEHTNRDGTVHPGADHIKGTADDVLLPNRFNVADANLGEFMGQPVELFPPDSYGYESQQYVDAQSRGIATLPGGIPIYKNELIGSKVVKHLVGGIGVFFPGKTGFATEENSSLSTTYDRTKPDRSLEAEWIAFAAVGGVSDKRIGALNDAPALPPEIFIPFASNSRIDLVGITLDIFGPGGSTAGPKAIVKEGQLVGRGSIADGANIEINPGPDNMIGTLDDVFTRDGTLAADGWLVMPHDSADGTLTAADVTKIINQGIKQANQTRAAIRLPIGQRTKMVFSVTDKDGNVLGLYRMVDATVFSEDVAVAKARNVAYYANASQLQPIDQLPGIPAGTAFTSRTFRYVTLPRFPEGIDGTKPGPFSILTDGHVNLKTAKTVGTTLLAGDYQSVQGYDAFNPGSNFRDVATLPQNQNGIVFFPGSSPLYKKIGGVYQLVGGLGVSGDGVDQDDVVTSAAQVGYTVPSTVKRADQVFLQGVRLPYQKFNRNPQG